MRDFEKTGLLMGADGVVQTESESFASKWSDEKRDEVQRIYKMLIILGSFADAVPEPWRCVISEESLTHNSCLFTTRLINADYSIVPVLLTFGPSANSMIHSPFLGNGRTCDDLTELKAELSRIFNHEKIKALYGSKQDQKPA